MGSLPPQIPYVDAIATNSAQVTKNRKVIGKIPVIKALRDSPLMTAKARLALEPTGSCLGVNVVREAK
jgi:hypothetical protein